MASRPEALYTCNTGEMDAETEFPLILASSSPRRRQLLRDAGVDFEAVDPPLEEPGGGAGHLRPSQQAEARAYYKARSVADRRPEACVLGADTVVASGGEVLGKPGDEDDARRMLRALGGSRHEVITGAALVGRCRYRHLCSETSCVTMRPISERELEGYIRSGEWAGKAGAYAIQETGDRFVVCLEGSFANVVGLPLDRVLGMITCYRRHLAMGAGKS